MAGIEPARIPRDIEAVITELARHDGPRLIQIAGLEKTAPCERLGMI